MLEVIRQITNMNKKGTKRGNTIIFVSFDLEEESKLNRTYLKLWWNNIYDNTIYINKHYYIKCQVIICRFILELYIHFNIPQNTGKLIKILIICGIYIILICQNDGKFGFGSPYLPSLLRKSGSASGLLWKKNIGLYIWVTIA
jgi:hypothetical protein